MHPNKSRIFIVAALALIPLALRGQSQPQLEWALIDGISGISENAGISIVATISPEDSGQMGSDIGLNIGCVFSEPPVSGPALPALRIEIAQDNLIIKWSASYPINLWQIEWTATPNAHWTTNSLPAPVLSNVDYQVTVPRAGDAQFFRLRSRND